MGCTGWDWASIVSAYREVENHELGASDIRGSGGPLAVSVGRETERSASDHRGGWAPGHGAPS